MGRLCLWSLRYALLASLSADAAPLWAVSSVLTSASASILAPGSAVAQQQTVIGAVTLPLTTNIGITAGGMSLPLPQGLAGIGRVRIGTESGLRDIARVVSRAGLQQASFTIIGDKDQVISIAVPSAISLSRLSGEGEVAFNPAMNLAGLARESRLTASADGMGELAFDVGGRVQPSPSATAGDYAGILKVTIQYN